MSVNLLNLRTTELKFPDSITEKLKRVAGKGETCKEGEPGPARSRVTGMLVVNFVDLVFIGHDEVKANSRRYLFIA